MYAKIRVNGKVVGKMQLLGVKFQKDTPLLLLFTTLHSEVAYMVEGVFTSVQRLFDENGNFETSFIGEKYTGRDEINTTVAEKMQFMKYLAECIGKKIQADLDAQKCLHS